MSDLRIFTVCGDGVAPYLDRVADLRIEVFREFPYLYDGDPEYERHYLSTYAKSPESLFVLAADGDRVVGASTGVPMGDETKECKAPFQTAGFDPERIFYYGESVLGRGYRGRGLGVRFFSEREDYARKLKRFEWCAFCAVDRDFHDPRKPDGYVFLDEFWKKRGFVRYDEMKTTYTWKEIGEASPTPKTMTFWLKRISQE